MKTAVSLPDPLFKAADALARRLGMSRSRLVQEALAEYVAKHNQRRISERLDEVYRDEERAPDGFVRQAARRTLESADW